jgi:hypothetical protein
MNDLDLRKLKAAHTGHPGMFSNERTRDCCRVCGNGRNVPMPCPVVQVIDLLVAKTDALQNAYSRIYEALGNLDENSIEARILRGT